MKLNPNNFFVSHNKRINFKKSVISLFYIQLSFKLGYLVI